MQIQIWSDMNWRLILTLVLLSGVLAYLGDVLGMRIGKRRISLFGLRPRDTSRVITAFTGILISIAIPIHIEWCWQHAQLHLIGFLLEHYAGNFPVWLAPEQVRVIPITDSQNAAAVFMGSRGHGGFVGMLLGSVSRYLVTTGNVPVVIIRKDA